MNRRTLPILPLGTLRSVANNPMCSQGVLQQEANFPWRKTHPGRNVTPKGRGRLTHPCGSRSALLWTLLTGWATVRMLRCARGMWQFSSARGMNSHLRIVRPHHQCWTPTVWLALLFIATTPTPNWSWGPTIPLQFWFTTFNSPSFIIFSDQMYM